MDRTEIEKNFRRMTHDAKAAIRHGEHVQGFCAGITEFASNTGGKNPQHAFYCLQEGKRRIEELIKYAAELERQDG